MRGRSERERSGGRQGWGGERGREVLQGGVRREREGRGGGEVGMQEVSDVQVRHQRLSSAFDLLIWTFFVL